MQIISVNILLETALGAGTYSSAELISFTSRMRYRRLTLEKASLFCGKRWCVKTWLQFLDGGVLGVAHSYISRCPALVLPLPFSSPYESSGKKLFDSGFHWLGLHDNLLGYISKCDRDHVVRCGQSIYVSSGE